MFLVIRDGCGSISVGAKIRSSISKKTFQAEEQQPTGPQVQLKPTSTADREDGKTAAYSQTQQPIQ